MDHPPLQKQLERWIHASFEKELQLTKQVDCIKIFSMEKILRLDNTRKLLTLTVKNFRQHRHVVRGIYKGENRIEILRVGQTVLG